MHGARHGFRVVPAPEVVACAGRAPAGSPNIQIKRTRMHMPGGESVRGQAMEFGVGYFPTHDGMHPGEVARLVEDRAQTALFFAEHSHIPASRESPYPFGEMPPKYWHCYDLFVALTAAVTATSRLRVGSGICLVVQRDPIHTAKAV